MDNAPDAGPLADYPPQVVFQVLLANNLTSFTEFAFGVVRPGVVFKPNWRFEAVTEKLSQVARGDIRRLIITLPPAVYGDLLNLAVWVKSNAGQGSFYRSQHELIGVFRVGEEPHLNNVELGRHGRSRSNVWHYAGGQHLSGGPPRRTSVASDGQAGRVGCRCHEGLHPPRR